MGLDHGLRYGTPAPSEDGIVWEDEVAVKAHFEEYRTWREVVEIIDWRKENHIHAWFVHNVQGGEDRCEDAIVSKEKLAEFVRLCNEIVEGCKLVDGDVFVGRMGTATGMQDMFEPGKVLSEDSKALAERLMPTQSGFFFGSTQYSIWYLKSLQDAVAALEPVLEKMAEDDTIVYWSSW
jgi:hypothetical protein